MLVMGHSRSLTMAPISRAYTTYCWSAIVRIALSCTIFDLCDLKIGVRGHSMSSKLVPFESYGVVSYSPSVLTVAVSVAVYEILSVKEWRDLEKQVRGCSKSLPTCI